MLVPMAKVEIVGHVSRLDAALELLQQLRLVQLADATSAGLGVARLAAGDERQREADDVRLLRTRLDALLRLLPPPDAGSDPPPDPAESGDGEPGASPAAVDVEALAAELDEVAAPIEELVRELDELGAERAALPRHLASLRRLLPLVSDAPGLERFETVTVLLDRRHRAVLDVLRAELADVVGEQFEVVAADVDAQTVGAALVFPRAASAEVHALLGREQVSEVRLPARYEGLSFPAAIAAMERRLVALPSEIDAVQRRMAEARGEHAASWAAARRALDERLARLDALEQLGATRRTFVIVGWVPRRALPALADALADRLGGAVAVEEVAPLDGETAPVLLSNRRSARPFEPLVGLVALPRQGSMDPTALMSAFLPLFFGMMLGDIVYGAVLLAAAVVVRRRHVASSLVDDMARVLTVCAAWSVVWGALYGEALGDLGHRLVGLEPLWFDRAEAIRPLLLFAVAVGVAHVTLGLVLGAWNAWREKARGRLGERVGALVALSGLFLLAGTASGRLPDGLVTPGVAAVAVGVIVLAVPNGGLGVLLGPLELLGAIGNVLSYLRLAAIGLASVYLARIANELGAVAPLWLGIVIAALFHALNLALGAFSPAIQALRLHYVEFFTKFVDEGGQRYQPFGTSAGGS